MSCWKLSSSTFSSAFTSSSFILCESSEKKPLFDIICSINNTFCLSAPPSLWNSSINKSTHRTLYQAGSKKKGETASLMKTKSLFLSVACAKTALQLILLWFTAHSNSSHVKFKFCCISTDCMSSAALLPHLAGS